MIQFGLETEIGIAVEQAGEPDVVADSIALVRSAAEPGLSMRWDYAGEDPHRDARGFRVDALRQDTDEAAYESRDAARSLTHAEIKSDIVLQNGARLYNDHAHPEYCTPECSTIDELVAHDRAGERILISCAQRLEAARQSPVRLYKNNTDFAGHSYGCHENYLLPRALPWEKLARGIEAFLVTRQIFAGAGKFAIEAEDRYLRPGFQLSQRADFFSERQGVDTMQRRPLINTRDEPHADPRRYRRFHVILGDANMSPFATRLKVGVTALVLESLVQDPDHPYPALAHPVEAHQSISRDASFRWEVQLSDGRSGHALGVQRAYLRATRDRCDLQAAWKRALLDDWEAVLEDLEHDWRSCGDRLDWVAKNLLVRSFQESEGVADDAAWLQSLDLEYHRLDPEKGLYYGLESLGQMSGVPSASEVDHAVTSPPHTTRAAVRGLCVRRFPSAILAAQWDHLVLDTGRGPLCLDMNHLFEAREILRWVNVIQNATTPDDLHKLA